MNTPKIILTAMIWVAATAVFSQTVSYEYYFLESEFQTMVVEDFTSITCLSDDYYLKEEPGKPALPVRSIKLMIPSDAKYVSHSIKEKVVPYLEDCTVFPMQPPVPTDGTIAHWVKPDSSIYDGDGVFPKEISQFSGMHIMGNYRIITIEYCPFRYYPKENRVELVSRLDLTIELGRDQKPQRRYENEIHFKMVKSVVDNPQDVIYTSGRSPVNPSDVQYLIITDANMIDDFQPLADWKTQKGVPAEVISIQSILSTYSGATDQLKIKTCLQDYYLNKGLQWVLLGGDNTIVPDQDCYGIVNANSSTPSIDNTIPTDLFYCCFDNAFDWNADGDNQVGEVEDNVDMAPEIFIGRAPVQTESQAAVFVAKTLNYEQNPPTNNFASKFVSSGLQLWNTWGGHSDAYWRSEAMWNEVIAPIWTGTKYKYYDTDTDFPGGEYFDVTQQNTVDILNDGYNIFWMATHGGQQSWAMESGDGFYSSSASALTNYMRQGLVVTMACNTNAFETSKYGNDPCLSEAFLRNGNGGAVMYHGSSRYGWGNGSAVINHGSSMEYARDFFYALFSGNPTSNPQAFASVSAESKLDNIGNAGSDGSYRWLMYSINNMGDPEMDVFTQDPGVFNVTHPTSVIAGVPHDVTVHTGVSGALVCLTDENTSNPVYVYDYADNNGDCTLSVTPTIGYDVTVTVSAPNYKPVESTMLPVSVNGPYVVVDYITAVTSDGDNNLEAGESATIDVKLINFGNEAANNITLQLDKTDPDSYITISDNIETVTQTLNPGDTVTISGAFSLDVDWGVYNGYSLVLSTGVSVTAKDITWYPQDFTIYSDIYPMNLYAENGNGEVDLSWYAPFRGWYSYQNGGNNGTHWSEEERGVLYTAADFGLTYPMYFTTIAHRFYEVEADPWNGNNKFRYNIYDYATNDLLFESEWLYAPSDDYYYYRFPEPYAVNADFIVAVEVFDAGGTNFPSSARNDGTTWPTCHSYLGSGGTWTTYPHEWMTHLYVTGDGGTAAFADGIAVGYNSGSPSISVPDGSTKGGAKSDIIGFNIYRDGSKINGDTPVDGYSYTDTPLAVGNYDYYTTAVYAGGESCPSNTDNAYSLEDHVIFFEDFENVAWYGFNCGWDFTTEYAYSGNKSIANAPWGNYVDNQDCWFRMYPELNLLNVNSDSAKLSLKAKFDIQAESDTCFVEVTEDFNSGDWQIVGCFTGTAFSWQQYSFDISDFIGKQMTVIFRMNTDESGNADGIYIDDVAVSLYDNNYAPPKNVEANAYASDVHLKWNMPMAGGEGWFSNWSWSNSSYFNWGEKASYIDLAEFGNPYPMLLTKVRHQFIDWEGTNWNGENEFKIRIWEKDGQTLIFESEVLYASHGAYEYELSQPLELNDDVLVTIKPMDVYPTSAYMSVTDNSGHGYLGNPDQGWEPLNGNWATEVYLVYSGAKDNSSGKWLEAGIELENVIEPTNPSGKQILTPEMRASLPVFKGNTALAKNVSGFNVYRDGQQINTSIVPGNYYYDTVPHQGVYDYYVKAVYPGDELSVRTAITSVTVDDVVLMYPLNAAPDEELTLWFDPYYSCEAGNSNSLEGSSEVRLHSGVGLNGISWSQSVSWDGTGYDGTNTYLTSQPEGQYTFMYTPSAFYGVSPDNDKVDHLDMVFNSGNSTSSPWDKEGKAPDGFGGCIDINVPLNFRTLLFEDDFESGMSNWITTGTWNASTDMFFTATHCLSDSPWSWYSGGTETTATLATGLDLSGYSSPVLEYNILHVLDNGDHVYVDISTDDFANFTVLKEYAYYDWLPWLQESISLDLYENQSNVKIRFRLVTDNIDDGDGVFIDDVKIKGYQSSLVIEPIPYTQDFAVYPTPDWEQYEGQLTTSSVLVPYTGTGDYDGWHEDGFNCHNTSGTGAIRGNIWSTNHYYWYNTPFIDLGTNTGGVILRFDMAGSYWNSCALANLAANDQFAVVISTDGVTWSSANILIEWVEGDTLPEYGETYEIDLSAYSGMVKFGFYHGHNGSSTDLEVFVDNVYVGFDYSPITIAEARALPIGSTVCVEGIVTNGGEFGNIRYLQDATGAIAAYGAAQNGSVYLGDEVTYEGELYNYYELLEISPIYNFEIQNSGQPLPLPINVEPSQWADSLESHLMVVDTGYFLKSNNVWSSRMFPSGDTLLFVTPGYDTAALFVDPNTDLDQFYIPDCPVAITGILGQYSSDPDEGFQLLPRQLNDFENVAIAPSDVQTDVSSNDVTLSWNSPIYNHNIPGLNEYIIYYNTSGTFSESDYHTTVYNEDPVIINDLENGLYYFWIKAVYDNTLDVLSDSVIAQVDYEFVLSGLVTDVNTGLGIPDVEMVFQSSDISSVYTNTNGYYEATVPGESFIRLVPEHACYSFTPYQYYLPGGITGNTTLDFTGDLDEITISGHVTDNAGAGIILPVHFITLETLDTTTVYTNGNGWYSNIQVPCDWCGYVLPELESYFFTPDSIVFENQIIDSYNNDFVGTPDSFPVSGTVTWDGQALEGVLLNFEDVFNDPTTASDGTYTCYVPAGWAGYIDPVKTGFTFTPSLLYVPSVSAPVTGQDFEATNDPLFINGVVKEGEYYIQGVEMVVTDGSGGVIESVFTNQVGYYSVDVQYGFSGAITPNKTNFTFDPTERTYTNMINNVGQQNFEAINTTQYTVSGIVTDGIDPVEGVTMTLSGSKTTTLTASDGSYSFTVARRSSGTVTPSKDGYTFVPESESFSNITTNISNFHFTGSVEEFAVSGTVTFNGSPLSGVLLDFDNIVNDPVSASDGTYSCVVPYGWSGHITPSLSGYSFDPAYHAVGVVTAPVSNQDFEAIEGNGLPPGWNFVNTGSNHTINIIDTAPMIDGVPLSYGSWIGVFFDDNGVEKCAGAIEWQGASSPIIAAQGDDSTTPGKDGFSEGEVITYKFYTNDVKGTEMYAAATYSSGPEVYTTNGTSVIPLLQASTSMTHTVQLPEGWSGVSSYIVPDNDSTSVIFAPVLDDFVILKSMTQAYWPPYANQIVHWNPYEGYKLKLNAAGEVNFVGGDTEKTLTFGEGWCLLPVLTNQNVDATALFAPVIDNLIIAKTIGGMGVYWPAVGVQTLLSLTPGESYMVKFSSPSTLSYPPLSSKSTPPVKGYPNPVVCDMWESPVNTGNTHIMAFSDDASQVIENGDFVGVFDINDRCVGLTEFSDTATLMITVYGDDPTTPEKDGLFYDEAFVVKVYNPTSNEIKELLMEYEQNMDVAYREDGLTLITKTTVATTGIGSLNLRFTKVYPNPTSDIIHVYVPGSETISLTARVIASNGGAILTELEFNGQCAINVHSFPAGVYLVQISDEFNEPVYRRFIKK